ncbi:MAG: hypothetical protein V1781_08085 [Bacteroidota bacterium]
MSNPVHALTVRGKIAGLLRVIASDDIEIHGFGSGTSMKVVGIWDTGATGSVITTKVINQLGIKERRWEVVVPFGDTNKKDENKQDDHEIQK